MPSKGTRSKDVSPVPSSEPRAPTHKSSHTSHHCSCGDTKTSKKSDSKSRGSKPSGSKAASDSKKEGSKEEGSKKEGSKKEGSKKEGSKKEGSKQEGSKQEGSKGSHEHDIEAPPSKDDNTALESRSEERSPIDWSLFPFALLGFIFGLLIGALLVVFFGFCCCIFSDWRSIWDDRKKRAFLGGFATGVLIAIIVWVAVFIALAVD